VDLVTHGLASLAVARAFSPRVGKVVTVAAVAAGMMADVDWISVYFGPPAFLTWRATYTHSLLIAAASCALPPAILLAGLLWGGLGFNLPPNAPIPESPAGMNQLILKGYAPKLALTFAPALCAAVLHVVMDACQSNGVELFWPFTIRRVAADWLPALDPWILAILIVCIAVPELLHLVSSEIGAKSKKPRGQTGALIGLALVLLYIGARATLHSNVVAAMNSRTFHGEPARRASAFPESLSLLLWHGVAETENALNQIEVNAVSTGNLDADISLRLFKPQNSRALDAAKNTAAARQFLAAAQIPKANVEKTELGYVVVIRDLRYAASGETEHEIAAVIELDANNKVTSQQLVWARDLRR
jgi:membrane-bound metal-dependent hydrolase YbcI (DUF457 family)